MMNINGHIRRMDSMMIEVNIRFLSRMELIYTCISKMVVYLSKNNADLLTETLNPYADPNDYNHTFYHQRNENMDEKIQKLLDDSDLLIGICKSDFEGIAEYDLFIRCLSEQTITENNKRRLRTKEEGSMNSSILQNPSDPDATYRNKAGKIHRGYVANLEESVGKSGSVVTDYQYEQNNYSDSQFLQDSVARTEKKDETIKLITDGAYGGGDNTKLAKDKNIDLITTALIGKDAPDVLADFTFKEDGTKLLKCAAGHSPRSCSYTKRTKQLSVSFDKELCVNCPYQEQCKPKTYITVARFTTSQNASNRAKSQRYMQHNEFKNFAKLRNGVETVPAIIRKNYHIEKIPRGKQRGKFFFGNKIAALNFRKLFGYRKGLGNYARNPILV